MPLSRGRGRARGLGRKTPTSKAPAPRPPASASKLSTRSKRATSGPAPKAAATAASGEAKSAGEPTPAPAPQEATQVPENFGGYVRGQELGRGAFAVVYACERASDGEKFAAKAVDLQQLRLFVNVTREVKKLRRETKVLQQLPPHPNLVKFVDVVQEGNWLFFLLELVTGGNLFHALVKRKGKRPKLRESEAQHVFRQLVDGLKLLHSKLIIHRDMKLENVLVVKERTVGQDGLLDVKIADFGLSKIVGEGLSEARSTVGSPRYMAPEVLAKGAHDFRADLWSLGIMAFVLLAGRFPCDGASAKVEQATLNDAVGKLPVSKNAQKAVLGLLQLQPDDRLTIDQLCSHPWYASDGHAKIDKRLVVEREDGGAVAKSSVQRENSGAAASRSADDCPKRLRISPPSPEPDFFGAQEKMAFDDAFGTWNGGDQDMNF